jgi:hypothetical protein
VRSEKEEGGRRKEEGGRMTGERMTWEGEVSFSGLWWTGEAAAGRKLR